MKTAPLERVTEQLRRIAGRGSCAAQTDRELLDRFLGKAEEASFVELVHRHGPMVLGVCRRVLRHQQDAEDAFQAAFLVLARKARTVRHAQSVAGWLFQVAFRLALRARSRAGRPTEQLTAMHEPITPARNGSLGEQDIQALVDEALNQLPDHYRTAIVLCCLEGRTQTEAARQLGTTTATINNRIKRARQLLRAFAKRRGLTLSTATLATALAGNRASAASFPLALLGSTSRAAAEFAAAGTTQGATAAALTLAQGALRTMWPSPLKLLTGALLLVVGLLTAAWLPGVAGGNPEPGTLAVATSAPALPNAQGNGGHEKPAKMHCIILWMSGGPSQLETFDPKPTHPNGGPVEAIDTSVKGVQISAFLPKLAKQADQLAIIRSLSHNEGDHARGHFLMHTGYNHDNQLDFPALGCILGKELGDDKMTVPRFVMVGARLPGPVNIVGAGYVGTKYGPLHVAAPDGGFRPAGQGKDNDVCVPPLEEFKALDPDNADAQRKAVVKALDRDAEKKELREAYGNNSFGQNCLIARRLIEQGVPVVEINFGGWDTHGDNFAAVEKLCDQLDAGFSTLIKDLKDKKLFDKTLIVWMGEFGRTPRINLNNGRDHWMKGFSVVLAGAKIKGGQVHGATSPDGMQIANQAVAVAELYATIYTAVGVDPARQYRSNTGAPVPLVPSGSKAIEGVLK
jgi:RNA polymerase sigma factor (sigma-70 family)